MVIVAVPWATGVTVTVVPLTDAVATDAALVVAVTVPWALLTVTLPVFG